MPRRGTTAKRTPASSQQSTLSFHGKPNRITKQNTSPRSKKSIKADPYHADSQPTPKASLSPPPAAAATASPVEAAPAADPLTEQTQASKTEDVLGGRAPTSTLGAATETSSGWVGDEEQQARQISETQIKRYWRMKESTRITPRVHQEGLSVWEKVLREWDMSGQYGPCIGISRLKRWKRANVLGLEPPIQVLAVLLKGGDTGDGKGLERAHVDELLSSRIVEP